MDLQDFTELTSIFLTVPTILFSFLVVWLWGPAAWTGYQKRPAERTAVDWFVLGVTSGFLAATLDNTFWQVSWNLSYLEHPLKEWFFKWGAAFNIFFRQGLGIYAAYCHVRSYNSHRENDSRTMCRLNIAGVAGALLGMFNVFCLYYLKFFAK